MNTKQLSQRQSGMRQRWARQRRGRGRPARELDTAIIIQLARRGCCDTEIARTLGCDRRVLRRYAPIIDRARAAVRAEQRLAKFRAATVEGDRRALMQLAATMEWPQPAAVALRQHDRPICRRESPKRAKRPRCLPAARLAVRQAAMKGRWLGRARGGRPHKRIDRSLVKELALLGYRDTAVAGAVNCDPRTLRANCQRLLRRARRRLTFTFDQPPLH